MDPSSKLALGVPVPADTSYANPLRRRFADAFFSELPAKPGVYVFVDASGEPLYIGKANDLRKRLRSYRLARPGRVPEHTLEMLTRARDIRWELHPSGEAALRREAELLHAVRPPYNIDGTEPSRYLYISVRERSGRRRPGATSLKDERLLDVRIGDEAHTTDGFQAFGGFKGWRRSAAASAALMRLLAAAASHDPRFRFAARLCLPAPPRALTLTVPRAWPKALALFLRGEDLGLLPLLVTALLANTDFPRYLYRSVQRDLNLVKDFFVTGPQTTRRLIRRARLARTWISRERMDRDIVVRLRKSTLAMAL